MGPPMSSARCSMPSWACCAWTSPMRDSVRGPAPPRSRWFARSRRGTWPPARRRSGRLLPSTWRAGSRRGRPECRIPSATGRSRSRPSRSGWPTRRASSWSAPGAVISRPRSSCWCSAWPPIRRASAWGVPDSSTSSGSSASTRKRSGGHLRSWSSVAPTSSAWRLRPAGSSSSIPPAVEWSGWGRARTWDRPAWWTASPMTTGSGS